MNKKEQELLARVVDLFAAKFDRRAVLRGGMVLKVLGSARYTNDLDYVFVPYKSKNYIVPEIIACLNTLENSSVEYSLNSKCLRIFLTVEQTTIQIEAKVAKEVKSAVVSTNLFSPEYNLPKRLIHIVDHSVSMANKLAAWNERRLARDLYDIWFFTRLNISPDSEILKKRLAKPEYSRAVKAEKYYTGKTIEEFYEFLRLQLSQVSDEEIENQLKDYLVEEELAGLIPLIRSGIAGLR